MLPGRVGEFAMPCYRADKNLGDSMSAAQNISELDGQNAELLPARTLLSVFGQDISGTTGGATGSVSNGTVMGTVGNTAGQVVTGRGMGNVGDFVTAFFSTGK